MQKMCFSNPQVAFDYALYVMASSAFAKTTCKSTLLEKNMLLQFREQKLNTQYQMEDICIALLKKEVRRFPKSLRRQEMTVHLRKRSGFPTEVLFVSPRYIVSFCGTYAGKNSKLSCRVWERSRVR